MTECFHEKLREGNTFLGSDLLDTREDIGREVNSREFAAIPEDQYASDDRGSLVGEGRGCLAGVGFRLRSGSGFATPSYGLEFVFHYVTCGLGSSAPVVVIHGRGSVFWLRLDGPMQTGEVPFRRLAWFPLQRATD